MKLKKTTLSGLLIKNTALLLVLGFATFSSITEVKAAHGQAAVSDIDHVGMDTTFTGSYTHHSADHVWIVFNANVGDVIKFTLSTGFAHHYWLYRANNGCVKVGNSTAHPVVPGGKGCLTLTQSGGNGAKTGTYSFTVATAGQYAFQLDAFSGTSGSYSATTSRRSRAPVRWSAPRSRPSSASSPARCGW